MSERRKYTRRQKLAAVLAADVSGVVETEKQSGIPESTIRYWANQPEFAEYRAKAREEMIGDVEIVMHLGWRRVAEALRAGEMEPRDALFAAEKASTIYQLVTGQATARTETKDISDSLADHEKAALRRVIDDVLTEVPAG